MKPPRGLSREEAALWARVAATVEPLKGRISPQPLERKDGPQGTEGRAQPDPPAGKPLKAHKPRQHPALPAPPKGVDARLRPLDQNGLDSSWDRKLARGEVSPDFTLDLHGHSLDAAHARLLHGLAQAKAMGARLVLVITGRPRPAEAADRGERRGAIRAKVLDWLAHSEHALDIAAIRNAHRRHGGSGALYVVLKRGSRRRFD